MKKGGFIPSEFELERDVQTELLSWKEKRHRYSFTDRGAKNRLEKPMKYENLHTVSIIRSFM